MTAFWTYENYVHKYARVHRGDCSHCNDGRGSHNAVGSHAGRWIGPFADFSHASGASEYECSPCSFCVSSA
jgi:hypothetical protein